MSNSCKSKNEKVRTHDGLLQHLQDFKNNWVFFPESAHTTWTRSVFLWRDCRNCNQQSQINHVHRATMFWQQTRKSCRVGGKQSPAKEGAWARIASRTSRERCGGLLRLSKTSNRNHKNKHVLANKSSIQTTSPTDFVSARGDVADKKLPALQNVAHNGSNKWHTKRSTRFQNGRHATQTKNWSTSLA